MGRKRKGANLLTPSAHREIYIKSLCHPIASFITSPFCPLILEEPWYTSKLSTKTETINTHDLNIWSESPQILIHYSSQAQAFELKSLRKSNQVHCPLPARCRETSILDQWLLFVRRELEIPVNQPPPNHHRRSSNSPPARPKSKTNRPPPQPPLRSQQAQHPIGLLTSSSAPSHCRCTGEPWSDPFAGCLCPPDALIHL